MGVPVFNSGLPWKTTMYIENGRIMAKVGYGVPLSEVLVKENNADTTTGDASQTSIS